MSQDANLEAKVQEAFKFQAQEQLDMCFISEEKPKLPALKGYIILSECGPYNSI